MLPAALPQHGGAGHLTRTRWYSPPAHSCHGGIRCRHPSMTAVAWPLEHPRTGLINLVHPPRAVKSREKLATTHVLVLPDDGQRLAIALELGLRSYADTAPGSPNPLMEAVEAQVTFTMEQGGWSEMFETQA